MKVRKIKAYKNQKCHECGLPSEIIFIVSPERTRDKEWRVCESCKNLLLK